MSNPKNTIITFRVNLTPDLVGQLHPARSQNDTDLARSQIDQFTKLIDTYIPGLTSGSNLVVKHNGEFTLSGAKAIYIRDTYARPALGRPAILTVVSEGLASELGL